MLFSQVRADLRVKYKQESNNWDGNPGQEKGIVDTHKPIIGNSGCSDPLHSSGRTRAPAENPRSGGDDSTFSAFLSCYMEIIGRTRQGERFEPACSASRSYPRMDAPSRIKISAG